MRQAIAYGTNRKQIIADVVGAIAPKTQPLGNRMLMPNQPGYVDNGKAYTNVNVAKAKALLSGLGFTMGSDGYFHPNYGPEKGQDLTLNIETTSGNPIRAETVQLFQAQMQQIGIKINIPYYDAATYFGTNLPTGQFDIAEFAWVTTPFLSGNQSIYCSYTLTPPVRAELGPLRQRARSRRPHGRRVGGAQARRRDHRLQPGRRHPVEGHGDAAALPEAAVLRPGRTTSRTCCRTPPVSASPGTPRTGRLG